MATDTSRTPRLSIRNLSKTYGSGDDAVHVIGDITFDVAAGEFVCIVGPSGIGKTTLLKCLTGLLPRSGGSAEIDGATIDGPPEQMAVVFQQYTRSLMPWLSVSRNVRLPLKHLKLGADEEGRRVDAALEEVGLADVPDRYPWQLSGGMQQRVAIARALAYSPDVLIMDEPFASVDAQTRFELEDLCRFLQDDLDITIVVVTHDIDEAVYLSDRVVVLGDKPARVLETVDIPLGAKRDQIETRSRPEFAELRTRVLSLIQHGRAPRGAR